MKRKAHGQLRRGQLITTYGPGALLDLPRHSGIVAGLESWPKPGGLERIDEPRLEQKLRAMTGVGAPKLYAPPVNDTAPDAPPVGVGLYRFPEWFMVQEPLRKDGTEREGGARSRRLVQRAALEHERFDSCAVVATRFVRACRKGHIDDLNWREFVHGPSDNCTRQLWLDEHGTSGDLADLVVRCECGKRRSLYDAAKIDIRPLGHCNGARPWLGRHAKEHCDQPSQLLIRTASNAYFPQVVSVLSLPDRGSGIEIAVRQVWDVLHAVDTPETLAAFKRLAKVAAALEGFSDKEVYATIQAVKSGRGSDKPVKQVELDALLAVPEGFGEDIPVDPNFHARRLPERTWRNTSRTDGIETVIQLHRLREVLALVGFTRFEAEMPDIQGEYESDVERAQIAREPQWFPAVENRGEGIFVQFRASAVRTWLEREPVIRRIEDLTAGHNKWAEERKAKREFPGGPYILLHTFSHLLLQSLAMRCGYPASSIRERIYADTASNRYGVLLYTGSPDAEGTLGGLVQQARYVEDHLAQALRMSTLCSNDPVCAQHSPGKSLEARWLHGAACHGCTLVAETSCEMRNEYLDRALVVPVLGLGGAAYFGAMG